MEGIQRNPSLQSNGGSPRSHQGRIQHLRDGSVGARHLSENKTPHLQSLR